MEEGEGEGKHTRNVLGLYLTPSPRVGWGTPIYGIDRYIGYHFCPCWHYDCGLILIEGNTILSAKIQVHKCLVKKEQIMLKLNYPSAY